MGGVQVLHPASPLRPARQALPYASGGLLHRGNTISHDGDDTASFSDGGLRFGEDEVDGGAHATSGQQKRRSPLRNSYHASDEFSHDEDDDRAAVALEAPASTITPSVPDAPAAHSVGDRQYLSAQDALVRGQGLGVRDENTAYDGSTDDATGGAVP